MTKSTQYYSVIRAQWDHIGFCDVHKIRTEQANENARVQKRKSRLKKAALQQLVKQDG